MPSLRHNLQTGPRYLAISLTHLPWKFNGLNTPPFWRTASVMGDRRHILDQGDHHPGSLKRTHGGFTPGTRALDMDFDFLETQVHGFLGGRLGGDTGREGRAFTRTLEALRAGGSP